MSKAKELARAIRDELINYESSPSLRQLVDAVLSEPEPEPLKGWIEVTDMDNRKILISINASIVIIPSDSKTIIQFPSSASDYRIYDLTVKESYDEIKQKIKEAG